MRPELTPIQIEANRRWWLNDLRSKAFEQIDSALRTKTGHCCLGVACESYRAATGIGSWKVSSSKLDPDQYYRFRTDDADAAALGTSIEGSDVARWLGMDVDLEADCINANDHGVSFARIATRCEKAWKMGRYAQS